MSTPALAMGESRVPEIYAVSISFVTVSTVSTLLRLHLRLAILRNFGTDDWLIIVAVLLNWLYFALHIWAAKNGYGKHVWEVSQSQFEFLLKNLYFSNIVGTLSTSFVKLSILYLYRRITDEPLHRHIIRSLEVFLVVYTITMTCLNVFMCRPIDNAWNLAAYPNGCTKISDLQISQSVVSIVTDIALFAMPLPVLFKLRHPRRDKIIILFILFIGALTIIASTARIAFFVRYIERDYSARWYGAQEKTMYVDMSWRAADGGEWTMIENNLVIICSCVFAVRRLWVTTRNKRKGPSMGPTASGGGNGRGRIRLPGGAEEDPFAEYESVQRTTAEVEMMEVGGKKEDGVVVNERERNESTRSTMGT